MKGIFSIIICFLSLMGCSSQHGETMVLLDEKVAEVKISESKGIGDMNENILYSFVDEKALDIFQTAIRTAVKQPEEKVASEPEYDVMVEYDASSGGFPTHGLHLWLGEEDEVSTFVYIADDVVYHTSPKMTNKLRTLLILGGE
ncbi:hypothetical protein [Oceanobacillus sp. Castelsardo]|uniref:hypothetical protein n=1 Tax=Oceanobacillus sp. Castelsardo TaxID=1851204 RepID=UPI00083892AF|nr:hypothetical protein [Oceanobacillus sp. Castelsardo]